MDVGLHGWGGVHPGAPRYTVRGLLYFKSEKKMISCNAKKEIELRTPQFSSFFPILGRVGADPHFTDRSKCAFRHNLSLFVFIVFIIFIVFIDVIFKKKRLPGE